MPSMMSHFIDWEIITRLKKEKKKKEMEFVARDTLM